MKRPPATAILPDGFVDLAKAIDTAGRIEYPKEWTGEEIHAEWDWRYSHLSDSRVKQMHEDRLAVLQELGGSVKGIREKESLEKYKAALLEEDLERNRPRQRREEISAKLRQLLHAGLITAKALLPSGRSPDLDKYVWAGESAPEILETGTVSVGNGERIALGSGAKPSEVGYVLLDRTEMERSVKGELLKGAAQSRVDIEAKCTRWLKRLMNDSPDERVDSKDNLYKQAKAEFAELGELARKAFNRAWDCAIAETRSKAWKAAGRPRGN